MAELIMPKMGDAMTEGKVVRWYKKPGDAVKKGEPVAEIETDKVNLDLEAESDGTLGEHAAQEGEMVPVGGVLAEILGAGEKAAAKPAEKPAEKKAEEKAGEKTEEKSEEKKTEEKTEAEKTEEEPQRRSTDKKESVKHTTG